MIKVFLLTLSFSLFSLPFLGQNNRSEIIKSVLHIQLNNDKLVKMDSTILQINERMGDNDAEISIFYSKGDKVSIGDAWIEDLSGNVIRKLSSKDVIDKSAISNSSLYSDDFVKTFELKHNQYPYRIVYSNKIVYSNYLSIVSLDYRRSKQPVKNGTVLIETPLEKEIRYEQANVNNPLIDTVQNVVQYKWNYAYESILPEVYSSINTSKAPRINIVPLNFKYGKAGSYSDWKSFGTWIYILNQNRDILPQSEKDVINKILYGVDRDKEKVKILYHYLQDYTRYINVSINIGGLQTYPAEYVSVNKYGDCKALTNYMKAILAHAGIKSYYTLIDAGRKIEDINMDFPHQAFNHVILTVPIANDTIYLECTDKNIPMGYIGTFIQGRKALLIDPLDSHFITIPPLKKEDVLCTRIFDIKLEPSGSADINLKVSERGENYELFNFLKNDVSKITVDKYVRQSILSGSFDLLDYKLKQEDRDIGIIEMVLNCKMHNVHKKYGNDLVISPFPFQLSNFETPDKRSTDLQIDYPIYYSDTIICYVPNKQIIGIPDNVNIESSFGDQYKLEFEKLENQILIYKTLFIRPKRLPVADYKLFYDFVKAVVGQENKNFYFETR